MKNFLVRLGSSISLVIITVFGLLSGEFILVLLLTITSLIGFRELTLACKLNVAVKKGFNILVFVGYSAVIVYYLILLFVPAITILFAFPILTLIAFMAVYVLAYPRYDSHHIMEISFSFIYAPVMLSCIYLTRSLENGFYFVCLIFLSSWICDACAYCVGMLFGKHKLAPTLSPKKSVEGAIGGIIGAAGAGALFGAFFVNKMVPELSVTLTFAIICGVGAVISQIGDLAASAIKRNHDIKDFGKLIPGHGGVLDRFDSVIFTAPVIYFLARILG